MSNLEHDQVLDNRKFDIIKAAGDIQQLLFGDRLSNRTTPLATSSSPEMVELYTELTELYDEHEIKSGEGVFLKNMFQQDFHARLYPFVFSGYYKSPSRFYKKPFGTWKQVDSFEQYDGKQPMLSRTLRPVHTLAHLKNDKVGSVQASVEEVSELTRIIWLNRIALRKEGIRPVTTAAIPNTTNYQ